MQTLTANIMRNFDPTRGQDIRVDIAPVACGAEYHCTASPDQLFISLMNTVLDVWMVERGVVTEEDMAIEAWFMEENDEDQRLPHHRDPKQFVSVDYLADLGVLYWKLNPKDYENDLELKQIRKSRGYNYMDLLDLCPERVENYEEKLKNFYTEHIHADEEIRYCLEGSGYFDVRDKEDRWVRIWIKAGDMIVLPAGIYHRFTLDTDNYVKLMRLFVGEPRWMAYNRPQEQHPARVNYIHNFTHEVGLPLEAH